MLCHMKARISLKVGNFPLIIPSSDIMKEGSYYRGWRGVHITRVTMRYACLRATCHEFFSAVRAKSPQKCPRFPILTPSQPIKTFVVVWRQTTTNVLIGWEGVRMGNIGHFVLGFRPGGAKKLKVGGRCFVCYRATYACASLGGVFNVGGGRPDFLCQIWEVHTLFRTPQLSPSGSLLCYTEYILSVDQWGYGFHGNCGFSRELFQSCLHQTMDDEGVGLPT